MRYKHSQFASFLTIIAVGSCCLLLFWFDLRTQALMLTYILISLLLLFLIRFEKHVLPLHPTIFFILVFIYVFSSALVVTEAGKLVFLLYVSCLVGYFVGWILAQQRRFVIPLSIKTVRFEIRIILMASLTLVYVSNVLGTGQYLAIICLHIVGALAVYRSKWFLGTVIIVLTVGFFSFVIGKVMLLRWLVFLLFVSFYSRNKRLSIWIYFSAFIFLIVLFVLFNYRRFILEGNAAYLEVDILTILTSPIFFKILLSGSDYFWSLEALTKGDWYSFGSFGSTYLSGLLKFFPQSFFIFRPDSGNYVMNSYLFEGYVKNSYTMAATFVGELFINFSIFAPLGASALGFVMRLLFNTLFRLSLIFSEGWLYLAAFFAMQFSLVRDDFNVAFGTFLTDMLIIALLVRTRRSKALMK